MTCSTRNQVVRPRGTGWAGLCLRVQDKHTLAPPRTYLHYHLASRNLINGEVEEEGISEQAEVTRDRNPGLVSPRLRLVTHRAACTQLRVHENECPIHPVCNIARASQPCSAHICRVSSWPSWQPLRASQMRDYIQLLSYNVATTSTTFQDSSAQGGRWC